VEEQRKRVLAIGPEGIAAAALRDLLSSDACCDEIEAAPEADDRIAHGDYALIVLDAGSAEAAEPVISAVRKIPPRRRPLLFVLLDDEASIPERLDPRVVTLLIRRPLEEGAVREVLEQTIKRILAVGGEITLKRLREAGAAAPREDAAREASVLIVDDEKAIRDLVAAVVRREGLVADVAADGDSAIEHLRETRYQVVVLDLMMPRLSGWEVIGWLRSNPAYRPRTVIISTAADRSILGDLDPDVVNAIFIKPFDVAELGAYVRACAQLPRPRDRRRRRIVGPA
jgi:CheY-like chemotaxis protein